MRTRDMLRISVGNLHRLKLRSFLTISGVVIAIGAFVSMLSFGAGNQRLVAEQFDDLGLLSTMLVFETDAESDSAAVLNDAAMKDLGRLPGVRLAFPYEDFQVVVSIGDSVLSTEARTLPPEASGERLFSRFLAGGRLEPDDAAGALVTEGFMGDLGFDDADSLLGRSIRVAVRSASPDSGFAKVFRDDGGGMRRRWESVNRDSLRDLAYVKTYVQQEAGEAARRFFEGYMNDQVETADTLTIRGVLKEGDRRSRLSPVVVPLDTARRFAAAGPGGDAAELLPALMGGQLFGGAGDGDRRSYSQVTLLLQDTASHPALVDSVEARGFRAFSYAAQFSEIRRMLVFFHLGLAAVGLVALTTAALGIVNTMLMSISERRREIGVLQALGAEDRDIHRLFLMESALIGAIGSVLGVALGWGVARLASLVAKELMRRQEVPPVEIFATPLWLVGTAIAFGIVVAIVAGVLPAGRAARVDPVEALRTD